MSEKQQLLTSMARPWKGNEITLYSIFYRFLSLRVGECASMNVARAEKGMVQLWIENPAKSQANPHYRPVQRGCCCCFFDRRVGEGEEKEEG
jgi:hypothetical protein